MRACGSSERGMLVHCCCFVVNLVRGSGRRVRAAQPTEATLERNARTRLDSPHSGPRLARVRRGEFLPFKRKRQKKQSEIEFSVLMLMYG